MNEMERITAIATPIAIKYGIEKMGLFGSRARGDFKENSDYDFIVSKGAMTTLLKYVSFVNELEAAFGTHVNVVTDTSNDQEFVRRIQEEEISFYEK